MSKRLVKLIVISDFVSQLDPPCPQLSRAMRLPLTFPRLDLS
jgi:hypothetical protein